jgi:hypothetical protein
VTSTIPAAATDHAVLLRARVRSDDPAWTARLLHYFLRLGADGQVDDDGAISVSFVDDDAVDIAEVLLSWSRINGVPASVLPADPHRFEAPVIPQVDEWQAPVRVGDLLVAKGRLTNDQLAEALVESRKNGEMLGQVLLRRRWIFEDELARTLAEQWDLPYLNLALIGVNPRAVPLLPAEVGMRFAAIPVTFVDGSVQVAYADPSDQQALDAVREHIAATTPAVAEFTDISILWRRFARAA